MSNIVRNADYTREYNRKNVLRQLRKSPMSRAALARSTGLSRANITLIVEEMLEHGYLRELPPQPGGRGRNATPLALRPGAMYALGVQISRAGCSVGLVDLAGAMVASRNIPEQQDTITAIVDNLENLCHLVDRQKILGIGISSPGPLDRDAGEILNPPRFERWHSVRIGGILEEALGIKAYLEQDVRALVMRQLAIGSTQNFMLLSVDNGIGAGIVTNGRLAGMTNHFTGELGHTTIRFDGRLCECGNRGCLETYAGIDRLLEGSEYRNWRDLIDHVDQDLEARRLLDLEAVYLSAGVLNLLNLVPVDTVLLTGQIAYGAEQLASRIQRQIESRALSRRKNPIRVCAAKQENNALVMAAAEIVFHENLTV